MKKHQTTMAEMIRNRCTENGMTLERLCRKTGISEATMTRHLSDGNWNVPQIRELHRFLHFSTTDAAIILNGNLAGPQLSDDLANQLLGAIVQAVTNIQKGDNDEED